MWINNGETDINSLLGDIVYCLLDVNRCPSVCLYLSLCVRVSLCIVVTSSVVHGWTVQSRCDDVILWTRWSSFYMSFIRCSLCCELAATV